MLGNMVIERGVAAWAIREAPADSHPIFACAQHSYYTCC
jgi:hypothetical protein